MPETRQPISVTITGDGAKVAFATASHSAAQAGSGNTAHVTHTQGTDLAALVPLLLELAQAIAKLPSPKARETLAPHVEAARAETERKDKADPSLIKRALDAIKPAADALEGGEKIVKLCNKAYQVLAPFLGLPPSPLS